MTPGAWRTIPADKAVVRALALAQEAIYYRPRQALTALMEVAAVLEHSTPIQGSRRAQR